MNTVSRAESPLSPYSPLTAIPPGKHHGFLEVHGARGGVGGKPEAPCSPAGADAYPHGVRGGTDPTPEQPRTLREGGHTARPMTYEPSTPEANAETRENGADNHARNEKTQAPVPEPARDPGFARTAVDPGLLGAGDSTQNDEAPALRHSTRCGRERDDGRVDKHHLHARPDGDRAGVIDNPDKHPRPIPRSEYATPRPPCRHMPGLDDTGCCQPGMQRPTAPLVRARTGVGGTEPDTPPAACRDAGVGAPAPKSDIGPAVRATPPRVVYADGLAVGIADQHAPPWGA
jgi:hypothetical protein